MLFIADFNTKTNDNDLFYRTSLEAIECRTSESQQLEINQFDHNPFDRLIVVCILEVVVSSDSDLTSYNAANGVPERLYCNLFTQTRINRGDF